MKITIVGSVFNTSGYSAHVRNLAESLDDLGHEVSIECEKHNGWEFGCPNKLFKILKNPIQKENVIFIGLPSFWPLKLSEGIKNFVGFVIWEGNTVPKFWKKYLEDDRVSQIWAPSKHTLDAIRKVTDREVKIVPHGVNNKLFVPAEKANKEKFVFVANKGWSEGKEDRGGIQYLIKAFKEEFKKDEAVDLFIKINPAYFPPEYQASRDTRYDYLNMMMQQLELNPEGQEIKISVDDLEEKSLPQIYQQGDVFVSTTRSEAFNLPGLEAMSCALPTLQTDYGGQLDYMTSGNSWTIDSAIAPVKNNLLYEGIEWATPQISDIKHKLRYIFEHQEEVKEKAAVALEDSKKWTWEHTARKAEEYLKELQ